MVAIVVVALAGSGLGALVVGAALAFRWSPAIVAAGLALVVGVAALFARAFAAACDNGCDSRPITGVAGLAVVVALCSGWLWVRASRDD